MMTIGVAETAKDAGGGREIVREEYARFRPVTIYIYEIAAACAELNADVLVVVDIIRAEYSFLPLLYFRRFGAVGYGDDLPTGLNISFCFCAHCDGSP